MARLGLAFAFVLAAPAFALADDVDSDAPAVTDPQPQLVGVRAALAGAAATLVIRYEVDVAGPQLLRGALDLPLPPLALATGATVRVDGTVHHLALGSAAAIDDALDALGTREGAARPWVFALHAQEVPARTIGLDVGVPRPAHVVIDVAATAPTCFFRDARYVQLDATWRTAVEPAQLAEPGTALPALLATCARDNASAADDDIAWLRLPTAEVASQPFGDRRIGVDTGAVATVHGEAARVEVALAGELADVPPDLHTAILVDNSRSLTPATAEQEAQLVLAYLDKVPATTFVQVVLYDRRPHALLPAWSTVAAARAQIAARLEQLALANGSNLDAALAEAGRWLASAPGTRRVIAFTDEELPWRLMARGSDAVADQPALAALLPAGTLVHVVGVTGSGQLLSDEQPMALSQLAAQSGGMGFRTATGDDDTPAHHADDATVLARPVALEHVAIDAPGWTPLEGGNCRADMRLDQGASCVWLGTRPPDTAAAPVRVTGTLWNRAFRRALVPSRADEVAAARAVRSLASQLDDDLADDLDRASRAVGKAWSLVARWGAGGGYAGHFHVVGRGTTGCGCDGGLTLSSHHGTHTRIRVDDPLAHQLRSAVAQCHLAGAKISLDLEMTADEIVAVDAQVDGSVAAHDCFVEAVWGIEVWLGPRDHRIEHVEWPVPPPATPPALPTPAAAPGSATSPAPTADPA